jgi:hypothetical protein
VNKTRYFGLKSLLVLRPVSLKSSVEFLILLFIKVLQQATGDNKLFIFNNLTGTFLDRAKSPTNPFPYILSELPGGKKVDTAFRHSSCRFVSPFVEIRSLANPPPLKLTLSATPSLGDGYREPCSV